MQISPLTWCIKTISFDKLKAENKTLNILLIIKQCYFPA